MSTRPTDPARRRRSRSDRDAEARDLDQEEQLLLDPVFVEKYRAAAALFPVHLEAEIRAHQEFKESSLCRAYSDALDLCYAQAVRSAIDSAHHLWEHLTDEFVEKLPRKRG